MISATRELLAPRADVWSLVAEPYHLPDWWPGYAGVQPDRLGLVVNARWEVRRGAAAGLLRRPGGDGLLVVVRVAEGEALAWHDVQQGLEMGLALAARGPDRTEATAWVDGPWWRLLAEGARSLPRDALRRLHALCQTAASL